MEQLHRRRAQLLRTGTRRTECLQTRGWDALASVLGCALLLLPGPRSWCPLLLALAGHVQRFAHLVEAGLHVLLHLVRHLHQEGENEREAMSHTTAD